VIRCAHAWLRTPYHHMGRVKGAGVDYAMLLAEVYSEAGRVPPQALHRSCVQLRGFWPAN